MMAFDCPFWSDETYTCGKSGGCTYDPKRQTCKPPLDERASDEPDAEGEQHE